jgi:outer membrane autotransporter protein
MSKKLSKLGKSILAGISVASLISGLTASVYAGPITRLVNVNTDTVTANFTPPGFNNGDSLTFGGVCKVVVPANITMGTIDFDTFNGTVTVNSGVNLITTTVKAGVFSGAGILDFLGDATFGGNAAYGVQSIQEIKIGNGTVNFTGTSFGADKGMNLSVAGSAINFSGVNSAVNLEINNTSGNDGSGSILISNKTEFDAPVGDIGARLEKMVFMTDSLVKFNTQETIALEVVNTYPDDSLGTGNGSLLMTYFNDIYSYQDITNNVGLPNLKLKLLAVSSTISENPNNYQVANLKTGRAVYANRFDIYPFNLTSFALDQSILNIETNTIVNALITISPIGGEVPSETGIVNVLGSSTLTGGIGEDGNLMPEVHFTSTDPEDVVLFTGDIYAGIITQESPNLILPQNTLFFVNNDSYHAHNSTHTLGLNTLTIHGSGDMTGTSVFNISANEAQSGRIVIDEGNFIMGGAGGLDSMALKLIGLTTTIPIGGERSHTVFGTTTGGGTIIIPDNEDVAFVVVSTTNPFMTWTYTNGIITERINPSAPEDIITAGGSVITDPVALANLGIIANSDSGARGDLADAIITSNAQELLDRLLIVITEVTEDSFNTIEDLIGDVSANLDKKAGLLSTSFVEDSSLKGISAGDAAKRYGAWASYSISSNTQGQRKGKPGYHSRSNGVTFGADTLINDETAIGFAIGYIDTKVNHKDSNLGDTSGVKSTLLSLYSVTELLNNWYVQAQAIFGQNRIDNTELRGTAARREYAKASFKSLVYAAAVEAGYRYLTENKILITPIIGIEFDIIGKSAYKEHGTTNQNLDVRKSAQRKLIGHTGVSFSKNFNISNYEVIPEIYGIIRHDFINKNLNVVSKLEGVEDSLVTRTAQNVATFGNIGLGVTSVINNAETTIGYDYYFGEKYASHQGTIKVRLNF